MARLKVSHFKVTGAQNVLYREYSKTGRALTWEAAEVIETEALVRNGVDPEVAKATVKRAIEALKRAGVSQPTRIPWGD